MHQRNRRIATKNIKIKAKIINKKLDKISNTITKSYNLRLWEYQFKFT